MDIRLRKIVWYYYNFRRGIQIIDTSCATACYLMDFKGTYYEVVLLSLFPVTSISIELNKLAFLEKSVGSVMLARYA